MHHSGRATVLAIIVGSLLMAGCSTSVRIGGVEIDRKVPFLPALERAWEDGQADDPHSQRAEKTGCWLLRSPDTGALESKALCGPIRHLRDRGKSGAFDEVVFEPKLTGEKGVEVDPDSILLGETGLEAPAGYDLYRPDGQRPIAADKVPEPPSPKAAPGFVSLVDETELAAPTKPKNGIVMAPGLRVLAQEVGTLQSLPPGGEAAYFIPADGEEFLAMKVGVTDLDYDQGEASANATYAVLSGDKKVDVSLANSEGSTLTSESIIVASVPKGADAELVVTVAGLDQTISLRTGERSSKTAEGMYRHFTDVSLNQRYSGSSAMGQFSVVHSVEFLKAKISAFDRNRGWAPKDHVWVQISWDNNYGTVASSHLYDIPTIDKVESLRAIDSSGKPCSVSGEIPILDVTAARGEVLISVPISAEQVKVTYAPQGKFTTTDFGSRVPGLSPRSGEFTMDSSTFSIKVS